MRITVLVNGGAGSVGDDERDDIAAAFAAAAEEADEHVEADVRLVDPEDLADEATRAADAGVDVVAVAGGDGTLGTVAGALAGTGVPMGILARGTFNNFAGDLRLPDDLVDAARVVVSGCTAAVDVADLNGRTFVNNSSLGVYPVMVSLRDRIREDRGWGKVRAVPVASARVLRRFPTRRMQVTVGDRRWDVRTPLVFVGNSRYDFSSGNRGERSCLDDGVLSVVVASARSRWQLVRAAVVTLARGVEASDAMETAEGPEVTIGARRHRVLVGIDGEVAEMRTPLRYRCRPGALLVRVPEAEPVDPVDDDGAPFEPDAESD